MRHKLRSSEDLSARHRNRLNIARSRRNHTSAKLSKRDDYVQSRQQRHRRHSSTDAFCASRHNRNEPHLPHPSGSLSQPTDWNYPDRTQHSSRPRSLESWQQSSDGDHSQSCWKHCTAHIIIPRQQQAQRNNSSTWLDAYDDSIEQQPPDDGIAH